MKEEEKTGYSCLVLNKTEWLHASPFRWTEKEIDNADNKGFIGRKYGVDCYLARSVPSSIYQP